MGGLFMRLFIAIGVEEPIKEKLIQVQQQAKAFATKGRFSQKEHLHLTLRFIGETSEENIPLIRQALAKATEDASSFTLRVDRLGHFQKRNLHVLWTGVQENTQLLALQKNLDLQLEEHIGLTPEDRPYTAHITLGRTIRFEENWADVNQQVVVPEMTMDVSKVTLFQSKQVKGKLRYIPLEHIDIN